MPEFDLSALTALAALITAIGAAVVSLRKAPAEVRLSDADATGKITQAAAALVDPLRRRLEVVEAELLESCEQVNGLELRVKHLVSENDALRENRKKDAERISVLENQVRKFQVENGKLKDWAERLVRQVEGLDIEPEPYDPSEKSRPARKFGGEW